MTANDIYLINDLLTYTYCKLQSTASNDVFIILENFYSADTIAIAHSILAKRFPEKISKTSLAHIEDIITFLQTTPDEILPVFICSNNFNIPPQPFDNEPWNAQTLFQEKDNIKNDISKLYKDIDDIESTMRLLNACNSVAGEHSSVSQIGSVIGSTSKKKRLAKRNSRILKGITASTAENQCSMNEEKPKGLYVCPKCQYCVEDKSVLKSHLACHLAGYTNQCINCLNLFANWKEIKKHKTVCPKTKHYLGLSAKYKCSHCSSRFSYKKSLISHQAYHDESRPFACDKCGYRFYTQQNLDTHSEVHTDGVHRCPYCEYGSILKSRLISHMLSHTGITKPYSHKCSACSFRTSCKYLLENHVLIHGKERRFKCEKCTATFKTKFALCSHRRIHNTDKPFKCPICKKGFKISTQMKRHYGTHSNKIRKPYSCPDCNYRARFPVLIRKHAQRHNHLKETAHNNIEQPS